MSLSDAASSVFNFVSGFEPNQGPEEAICQEVCPAVYFFFRHQQLVSNDLLELTFANVNRGRHHSFFISLFSAWIEENNIKPYFQFKDQLVKSNKSAAFKEAITAIEDYIKNKGEVSYINGIIIPYRVCTFSFYFQSKARLLC